MKYTCIDENGSRSQEFLAEVVTTGMMLALIIFLIGLCKLVEKFIVDPIKKKQVLALEKKLEEDKKKKELSKEKAKQSLDSAKNFKTCLDAIVLFMKKYQNDFLNKLKNEDFKGITKQQFVKRCVVPISFQTIAKSVVEDMAASYDKTGSIPKEVTVVVDVIEMSQLCEFGNVNGIDIYDENQEFLWDIWHIVLSENKSIEEEFIKKLSKYGVMFDNYSGKPEVDFDGCGWEVMCAIFNLKI